MVPLLITLNVALTQGKPQFTEMPSALTVNQGQNYTTTPLLDIAKHLVPGSGSIKSITAELTDGNTLSASGLSFTHNTDYSTAEITGTANAAYAGTTKTLQITVTNSNDESNTTNVTLTYTGLPVVNSGVDETFALSQGQSLSQPIDLSSFFTNPALSGSLSFDAAEQNSIEVIDPDNKRQPLTSSALGTNGITLSGSSLTGKIPNSLTAGTYQIIIHGKNTTGYSTGEASLTFNVAKTGAPTFDDIPTTIVAKQGQSYTSSAPLLNLASHIAAGASHATLSSVTAELVSPDTLAQSGLAYSHNGTFSTDEIIGVPNAVYAGQSKTLKVTATNSVGNSNSVDVTINYAGLPARNGTASPVAQTAGTAAAITPVDLSHYFTNPNFSGELTFSATDINSIKVTTPSGGSFDLANSPLGQVGSNDSTYHLTLDGSILTGSIPETSVVKPGTYAITFYAHNDLGQSKQAVSLSLTVNKAVGPPEFTQNPAAQSTKKPGDALNPTVNLNASFSSAAPISFSADNTTSIEVTHNGDSTTFANSPLAVSGGLRLDAAGGVTTLAGNIPSSLSVANLGAYTISFTAKNDSSVNNGYAQKAASLTLNIGNVPQTSGNPNAQTVNPGAAITAVTLNNYFTDLVPSISGDFTDITSKTDDPDYIKVSYNGATATSLQGSALSGLTVADNGGNYVLSGSLPNNIAPGTYAISFRFTNTLGLASSYATFNLNVPLPPKPVWNNTNPSNQANLKPGATVASAPSFL